MIQYVVYWDPADHPGKWVVRRFQIGPGTIEAQAEPVIVCDELHTARRRIPSRLVRIEPDKRDHPCIREVWL